MGNGCCNEDRHESDRLLANGAKLSSLITPAKEVEAALPRLNKETNRTRQTIDYLKLELETISKAIVDTENDRTALRTDVADVHEKAKALLTQKTLHYMIGSNADQAGLGPQATRYGKEGLARKLLDGTRTNYRHYTYESGKVYSRSLSDQLHVLLDQHPDNQESIVSSTLTALESALLLIQNSVSHLHDLEDRTNKVSSKLSIDLQASLQSLATEVSNVLKSKQEQLQQGLAHDAEIAGVGKVTKPSVLYEKVLELEKALAEMQTELGIALEETELHSGNLDKNIKEITQLEVLTEEYIADIGQISSVLSPVPKAEDDLPTQIEPAPGHIDGSMEDYYLGKIQEMRKILVTEDIKLKSALDKQSELDQILTAKQEELRAFKVKLMIMTLNLQHVRTQTRLIRLWRLETEKMKWETAAEISRDSRIENDRISTARRKIEGLVRNLSMHWIWGKGRVLQIWKEAVSRRNQVRSFFPDVSSPQIQRAKARSMAAGLILVKRRFQMYAFAVVLRSVRRRKAAAKCGYGLKRCIDTRLAEGWRRLLRASQSHLSSEEGSLGDEFSFEERMNEERSYITPVRNSSGMRPVTFGRASKPS